MKEDWTGKRVKCIDPVETDMFENEVYEVTRDYGTDVCIHINGLDRLYTKDRFEFYTPEKDDSIKI